MTINKSVPIYFFRNTQAAILLIFISGLLFFSCGTMNVTTQPEKAGPSIPLYALIIDTSPPVSFVEPDIAKDEEKLNLSIAEKHFEKGRDFFEKGDYETAVSQYMISLVFMPSFEKSKAAIKEAKQKIEDDKKEKLRQHNMELAEGYYEKGSLLYKKGDYKAAVFSLQNTLELFPEHPKAAGLLKKAEADLKEYNLKKASEYNDEGLKEYSKGNLEKAISLWEKALSHDPQNEESKMNIYRARKEQK